MYKTIKVDAATHLVLKVGASNRGTSIKEHLALIASKNIEPVPFNVGDYDIDTLRAVRDDIEEELSKWE